ncbi:MAG: tail fiber domain-containing protein, partial [Bacteroidales bacterium]|nr:tail fiber domain-containing protein [Bacteroidales bacterium]
SDGDAKGLKGGFAVGGFGTDKAESTKYMFIGKDSVRFYLDTNPLTKKLKGGFAVGGFDLTKGTVQNYLDVSADSVRIYIDSNPEEKKLKGGFAVGGYDLTKGITGDYFNVSGKSDAETINGEARVLWYPAKEAFRSGNVLIESKDSVGTNSWASGYQSKAIGNYSQALGYKAIARGGYSTAIGRNASALGQFSFAFGDSAVADGTGNYAYGSAEIDTVTGLSIPGTYTKAAGTNSIAFGLGAKTMNGSGNIAIGMASEASGDRFALAIGEKAKATNYRTISIGHWGAYGVPPTLMLYQKPNLASGSGSMAIGYGNTSSGNGTLTIGTGNTASESNSFAIGRINRTYGQSSFALGYHLYVYSYMATAIGRWNADNGTTNSWVSTDPLFMIGNGYQLGSSIIRRNAVTVLKSGAVGIGINTPGYTLDVNGEITSRTYNGLRIRGSSYSTIVRNDGSDFYLLVTAAGDPDGSWNNLRPFSFNLANGSTYLGGQTLTVIHGGNVGIGTTSPSYKLTVLGTAWCSSGTWTGSDIRWKENIFPITDALTGIKKLNPVSYNLKTSEFPQMGFEEGKQIGLIAQEVEKIYPELVRTDNQNYKSVSYEKLTVVLLEAVKEQQQEIESQQQQIDELRALVEKLVQK